MIDFNFIKKNIVEHLKPELPEKAAMFEKNWKRYRKCLELLDANGLLDKGLKILDFGCGNPYLAKMLNMHGCDIVALEPYAGESEKKAAKVLGIETLFLTELPANTNETFDVVLLIDVIEHFSVINRVMKDIIEKIKPGGKLFVSTPNVMRIEMWLSFVLRQTGHPQPLLTFLRSENNYVNHQREFTLQELITTMGFFGLKTIYSTCCDTQPTREELARYHSYSNTGNKTQSIKNRIYQHLSALLRKAFPQSLTNNLFVIAQKRANEVAHS